MSLNCLLFTLKILNWQSSFNSCGTTECSVSIWLLYVKKIITQKKMLERKLFKFENERYFTFEKKILFSVYILCFPFFLGWHCPLFWDCLSYYEYLKALLWNYDDSWWCLIFVFTIFFWLNRKLSTIYYSPNFYFFPELVVVYEIHHREILI